MARELATESDDSACQFVGRRAAWPARTGTAHDLLIAHLHERGVFDHLVFMGGTALRKLSVALSRVLGATATSPPWGSTLAR
jgi:hypothetical protein